MRDFLVDFTDETMNAVDAWSRDENHGLAGSRVKPPCVPRITLPADAALPVLDRPCADPSAYIRTSVANQLQDLAGAQPDVVLATSQRWQDTHSAPDKHLAFIARTALRNKRKMLAGHLCHPRLPA